MNRVTKIATYLLLLLTMWGGQVWAASNSSQAAGSAAVSPSGVQVSSDNKTTLFLSGVVIYGENRSALFEIERDNKTTKRQVKEGEKIGGYTLDKVEKDRVLLKGANRNKTLLLKRGIREPVSEKAGGEREKREEERKVTKGNTTERRENCSREEVNLEEHREEVQRGIMELLRQIPNPMSVIDKGE